MYECTRGHLFKDICEVARKSKRLTQEVGLLYKKVEDLESRVREDEAEKDATK